MKRALHRLSSEIVEKNQGPEDLYIVAFAEGVFHLQSGS